MTGIVFIAPYSKQYSRADFSCGNPDLDRWLKTQASQHERSGNTRTFLAISRPEARVVGYYATTTYRLDLSEASIAFGIGKRRFPVPAVLLARLAVDQRVQGRGIGAMLLIHALREVAKVAESVGFEVFVVHAIDPEAANFYARSGFTRFHDDPLHLYLTTKDLLATLTIK